MWVPLTIVLLVSLPVSGIMNTVITTHSPVSDTPMNNKYTRPAPRLYATHNMQPDHHIPNPIISLSPEAFALNMKFVKSSKPQTTHLFRSVAHNFDSNTEYKFILQKCSRESVQDTAEITVPSSVASRSETSWNVGSGVKGTSSSSELPSLYLPTDSIGIPSTMSNSQYFEITQKSDFSSESGSGISESLQTSMLVPTVSDTDAVNTKPASRTARFTLLVTDFNVLPTQTTLKSEIPVESQSNLQVPFYKVGTTSEKTVQDFVVSVNCTEQQDATISLKDMTEPADTFPKTSPNLTLCSEVFRNLSLKLERMNVSVHKTLDKFTYEYEHFLHIDRYNDPHMDNVMICQTVENEMKVHLQDADKAVNFLIFNCSTDLNDPYTDIKLNIMKLDDICWLYNETESIIFSWAKENENLLNSTRFIFNRLFTSHDVFTFRNTVKSYDEVTEHLNGFTRRKELLCNSASSRNLSYLLNTSFMLNYSDFQTETIKRTLQEYNYWKNILIDSKNGTRYDTLLFVRGPLYCLILIIGLTGNCTMLLIFALRSEMRKPSDLLILNLVISDVLNLITNIIPHFVTELNAVDPFLNYGVLTCQIITGLEFTSIGASAWSVVALSIQRYRVFVMSSENLDRKICCVSNKQFTFISIAAVWILSVALSVPNSLDAAVYVNGTCSYLSDVQYILYRLLAYSVIPLVIITILYTLTAGRLARSASDMPGEIQGHGTHKRARMKGAKVLLSLTGVFALSYMPYFLISYFAKLGIVHKDSVSEYVGALIFFLLFLNSAVNPVAIYINSANYRKYFNRYLFACFCAKPCRDRTNHRTARVV